MEKSPLCKSGADSDGSMDSGVSEDFLDRSYFSNREQDNETVPLLRTSPISTGITWYKASFLIVNAALGAGLLNFPLAFEETGGIISGNVIHLIFVCLALGSLYLLALCAREKNCDTYQEVVKSYCGEKWAVVCSILITVYCFVTCITFIIIIGDQFDRAFASFFGTKFCLRWYLNRDFTMVISSLFLIFPCCLKRIDGMKVMSYIGIASILYLTVVIAIEMSVGTYEKGDIVVLNINVDELFKVLPTICFGYQCHVSSVPILSCLKKRDKSSITKACVFSITVCFLVYTVAANCGYLTFGSLVSSDILLNYDAKKGYVLLAVLLLAMKSWTTYPILLFCVREAVADLYLGWKGINRVEAALTEPKRRKLIATWLWLATLFIALFIPGLNTVVKLLGSLAGFFILIFPGMCYLVMIFENQETSAAIMGAKQWAKIILAVVYIAIGFFSVGLAFVLGVENILLSESESDQPICSHSLF